MRPTGAAPQRPAAPDDRATRHRGRSESAPGGSLAGVLGGDDAGAELRVLDLRLLLPALLAWGVLVTLLPRSMGLVGAAATLGLVGAVVLLRVAHVSPAAGWTRVLAMSCAAVGLVTGATALHVATSDAGLVTGWAEQRATSQVELVVTTEPRVLARGDERQPLVVLEARVTRAQARGQVTTPRTPVVLFASAGQGWEDVRWRSIVATTGRWAPAEPGDRTRAVLTPRGGPSVLAEPTAVLRGVDVVRDRFRVALQPLPTDSRGLVPGLVIGDTSLTPADLTEAMRVTGMTHLSAVSGSNVSLVCGAVAVLLARVGTPRRWRTPLVLLSLVGFVLLCRPEPSVLRAGVMGSVGLLALTTGRRRASLPALGAAVIGLLCLDPWLARSYGFALSTLATLGLVLWARPWGRAMARHLPARLHLLAMATAIPLSAQVICAPVIVLLQGHITTHAVLANLLAAPLVAPTTVLGVLAACLAPLSVPLSTAVAWLAALPAWVIGRVARVCAQLPYGTIDWLDGPAGAWLLTALTVLVLVTGPWWWHQARRRPWWAGAALAAVTAWLWPSSALSEWPPPGWVVVGCDVGQGDAFVVSTAPARALVVDTGPDPPAVGRCLRDLGVRDVDLLVLTHFHADHVGGLAGVLGQAHVDAAYVSPVTEPADVAERTLARLAGEGVSVHVARAGDVAQVGGATVEVVGPGLRPAAGGSAANNGSVVLDVVVEGTRVLLTGDLEPEGMRPVRQWVHGRDYDVLKVAHHGSAAQDERLIRGARAEVALIGVGADNTFGHPAPSLLTLLQSNGAVVLRTDLHGDIAVARDDAGRLVVHRRRSG
ncbi:DNA internalization-related competence protein ComEC/Rec2 [Ornithinimicrobium pratense]|uniref:DNA internalization-related competence protein ComEC/Rec2 n=1 Tax=Ornithinimicrobium pratense TaxID=2593973 RepID=A0A5J6V2U7_9MICO|nr:DNA internalization-related competence protein ComEC/Rec2 [Ornithinimicrobium pratense]QFG68055.1 DNA internalization-related competence protein ComEC/Rec2 [Ornithinimicrobium pratense]